MNELQEQLQQIDLKIAEAKLMLADSSLISLVQDEILKLEEEKGRKRSNFRFLPFSFGIPSRRQRHPYAL